VNEDHIKDDTPKLYAVEGYVEKTGAERKGEKSWID
jgi:hypothetical protein